MRYPITEWVYPHLPDLAVGGTPILGQGYPLQWMGVPLSLDGGYPLPWTRAYSHYWMGPGQGVPTRMDLVGGTPHLDLAGVHPKRCGQTPLKTVPSRRTMYVDSNKNLTASQPGKVTFL